jgi:hypothetical protein
MSEHCLGTFKSEFHSMQLKFSISRYTPPLSISPVYRLSLSLSILRRMLDIGLPVSRSSCCDVMQAVC